MTIDIEPDYCNLFTKLIMNLQPIRQEINAIDSEILKLINARGILIDEVTRIKIEKSLPTFDAKRETDHIKELVEEGREIGVPELTVTEIFTTIMEASRAQQDLKRGMTKQIPLRDDTFCMLHGWRTHGIDGEPGSTKRVCPSCRRPLTTKIPEHHSGPRVR